MVVPMGTNPEKHPKPFVKLENGTTVGAKTVKTRGNKIKTDSATYKSDEVVSYSDGKNIFALGKRGIFAPKIYEGKINVYETSKSESHTEFRGRTAADPTGWHTSQHTHTITFVEKAGTGDLRYMNYKTLKDMIPPSDPAFEYLKLYKRHKTVDKSIMAGGLVLFVAGAAILGKSVLSTTGKGETLGGVVLLSAPVAILTGFIMHSFNLLNQKRAVAKYNGMKVK